MDSGPLCVAGAALLESRRRRGVTPMRQHLFGVHAVVLKPGPQLFGLFLRVG